MKRKVILEWAAGGIKAFIAAIAGFWQSIPGLTQALLLLMVIDVIMGVLVAIKNRNVSPSKMWRGITFKKMGTLALVAVAAIINSHIQPVVGIDMVQASSMFYVATELSSIVRNAATLDIPVFTEIKPVLRYFNEQKNDKGDS